MSCNNTYLPEKFFAVRLSYKNTVAVTRGQFPSASSPVILLSFIDFDFMA